MPTDVRLIIALDIEALDVLEDKVGTPSNLDNREPGAAVPSAPAAPAAAPAPAAARPAAPASRGGFQSGRGASTVASGGRGGGSAGSRGAAAAGGPLYPIEGLSPYQNK